jgi:hypothetical protein
VRWREHWPIAASDNLSADDIVIREGERDTKIHMLGNLTLLTHVLNSKVSNGPFSSKIPALRAQAALELNRELWSFDQWDENAIAKRGASLFKTAKTVWPGPSG